MTVDQVNALRQRAGFVTPWGPVESGSPEVMFNGRGFYEWMMHPDDAFQALAFGYMVDGVMLPCECVDVLPFMGALMIRAADPNRPTDFVDSSGAKPIP